MSIKMMLINLRVINLHQIKTSRLQSKNRILISILIVNLLNAFLKWLNQIIWQKRKDQFKNFMYPNLIRVSTKIYFKIVHNHLFNRKIILLSSTKTKLFCSIAFIKIKCRLGEVQLTQLKRIVRSINSSSMSWVRGQI